MWNPPVHFFQPIYNGISKFLFPVQNIPERLATRRWMQKRESKNLLKAKKNQNEFLSTFSEHRRNKTGWPIVSIIGTQSVLSSHSLLHELLLLLTLLFSQKNSWDRPDRYVWISMKQTLKDIYRLLIDLRNPPVTGPPIWLKLSYGGKTPPRPSLVYVILLVWPSHLSIHKV